MLPDTNRLRSEKAIEQLFKSGRNVRGRILGMKLLPTSGPTRFAFIVSTKISKSAVVRNRIKRQMREIVRPLLLRLQWPADIALMAQGAAKDSDFSALRQEVVSLLIRARLLPPLGK